MNKVEVLLYDAFADRIFGGNIAGVVLDDGLTEEVMRKIAAELAAPTTGFVSMCSDGTWGIRFFTPTQEIDMCGHVLIGVFSALVDQGNIRPGLSGIRTTARARAGDVGVLVAQRDQRPLIEMSQRLPVIHNPAIVRQEIAEMIGVSTENLHPSLPIEIVSTGLRHLIISTTNVEVLSKLAPNYSMLANLSRKLQVDTVPVIACDGLKPSITVRSRDFCPGIGNPEESASGTTNGAIACYLVRHGQIAGRQPGSLGVVAEQGVEMGRPSIIETEIDLGNDGEVIGVRVRASAVRSLQGYIHP